MMIYWYLTSEFQLSGGIVPVTSILTKLIIVRTQKVIRMHIKLSFLSLL